MYTYMYYVYVYIYVKLLWADLGQVPDAHAAAFPFTVLIRTGKEMRQKSSWGKIERDTSLITFHHGQNRLDLRKTNSIYYQLK